MITLYIIVAYLAGTMTGAWIYRRTLMGRVAVEFAKILRGLNDKAV